MPNLIGTGLNQVPINGMLGGLAYQDPEHASIKNLDLKNLSQINAEIADTALDVFVYDTSRDSDGGAWRKRTQTTSWYNETLNTSTRGSRKEFPAVAVIVAETGKVTIYDGDDPDMPMWMVVPVGTWWNASYTSLAALNGIVVMTNPGTNGRYMNAKFVADSYNLYDCRPGVTLNSYTSHISDRQTVATYSGTQISNIELLTGWIWDVAMTVLPNAPIDPSTGLPIPTIAFATDSGVSVIKDDGTVADITAFNPVHTIQIDSNSVIGSVNNGQDDYLYKTSIPTADTLFNDDITSGSYNYYMNSISGNTTPRLLNRNVSYIKATAYNSKYDTLYRGGNNGFDVIKAGQAVSNNSSNPLISYIASDYNTGYMPGDCKGAFLSDTVTEKDGVNYALSAVADGTGRLSSETYDDGDTSWSMLDASGTSNGYVLVGLRGLTVGQSYIVSMTWDGNATLDSGYEHRISHFNGLAGENHTDFTHWNKTNGSSETLTGVFTAQSTDSDDLVIYANAITLNISNFKVEETDDIAGSEKIPNPGNGNFTATTDWAAQTAGGTLSINGGNLKVNCSGNYHGCQVNTSNLPTLVEGKQYIMTVDVAAVSGGSIRFGVVSGMTYSGSIGGDGVHHTVFTAGASVTQIFIDTGSYGSSMYFELNSVNLREAELDRSLNGGVGSNNKGLAVYGTITKSPVATGTDLVGYSGWSSSNYLSQAYNSDLDYGTGDFWYSVWVYKDNAGSTGYIFDRSQADGSNRSALYYSSGVSATFYTTSGHFSFVTTPYMWQQLVIVRRGSITYGYLDGEYKNQNAISENLTGTAIFNIGKRFAPWQGDWYVLDADSKIALFRTGATAPSPEQIKKIYEDEKHLFQENAKATLYGSSDAVTALAYDDTTNLLHVGTSAGRSEFQGLRRINNTTDAVTTAISASNGLVAEQ